MKRSQFAILGLLVGCLIYGGGGLLAIAKLVRSHGAPGDLAVAVWPLLLSLLFGVAALVVYRRTVRK